MPTLTKAIFTEHSIRISCYGQHPGHQCGQDKQLLPGQSLQGMEKGRDEALHLVKLLVQAAGPQRKPPFGFPTDFRLHTILKTVECLHLFLKYLTTENGCGAFLKCCSSSMRLSGDLRCL